MVICSKWLRAQVGWSFIDYLHLELYELNPTYALSYS